MSVRKLKPITPGQRFRIVNEYSEVTTSKPEKSLLKPMKKSGGRNNQGRMTMRYKAVSYTHLTLPTSYAV